MSDKERRYSKWAGNPEGVAENKGKCIASVYGDWYVRQCSRNRGHGKDGLYCKQHAKIS